MLNSIDFNENDESNHFPELIQAITQHLDYKKWGFSYEIFHAKNGSDYIDYSSRIIFQSIQCKLQVGIFRDIRDRYAQVYFLCGRLHASNIADFTIWNGEKCHCWQTISYALNFLDGLTPEEAAKNLFSKFLLDFRKNNKQKGWSPVEEDIRMLSAVLNQYGTDLFNLFDLRNPDLWQKYYDFYKRIYHITSTYSDNSLVPQYKIC